MDIFIRDLFFATKANRGNSSGPSPLFGQSPSLRRLASLDGQRRRNFFVGPSPHSRPEHYRGTSAPREKIFIIRSRPQHQGI